MPAFRQMASPLSGDHLSTRRSRTEDTSASPPNTDPTTRAAETHRAPSQPDDTDDSSPASPNPQQPPGLPADSAVLKKRKTGPGSRGVANLTPEQLEKKRANDREAQRNIRERNKALVEDLRARIASLESQQPYQDLQAALRAKEAAEAENADLKRRIVSVLSMLQPVLSSPGPSPPAPSSNQSIYPSPGQGFLPMQQQPPPPPPPPPPPAPPSSLHDTPTPSSGTSPAATSVVPPHGQWQGEVLHHHHPHEDLHHQHHGPGPVPPPEARLLDQQRHEYLHGLDMGTGERLGLEFLLGSAQRVNRIQCSPDDTQDTSQFRHMSMKHDWSGVAHGQTQPPFGSQDPDDAAPRLEYAVEVSMEDVGGVAGGRGEGEDEGTGDGEAEAVGPEGGGAGGGEGDGGSSTGAGVGTGMAQDGSEQQVYFSLRVKNCAPTCPLDRILLDFLSERQRRAVEGLPTQDIIGPKYPSVSSLLNPASSQFSNPVSKVFTDILQTFPSVSGLPERVATLYVMFLFKRWQISPSRENFDRMPTWMAPVPAQLEFAHPAWADHLPFPRLRDRLVRLYDRLGPDRAIAFEDFFIPFTTTISINWPYEETDALLQAPDSDELMINPVFERHLRRLENWTLGDDFARALPALEGTYNLKSESAGMAIRLAKYA